MTTNSIDTLTAKERGGLQRSRQMAKLLDDAISIPGTNQRIGIDGIVGLVPIAGDWLTGVLSCYVIIEAWRLGATRDVLIQMCLNLLIETVIGSVPVIGDMFDVAWKANLKNVSLLEDHLGVAQTTD